MVEQGETLHEVGGPYGINNGAEVFFCSRAHAMCVRPVCSLRNSTSRQEEQRGQNAMQEKALI